MQKTFVALLLLGFALTATSLATAVEPATCAAVNDGLASFVPWVPITKCKLVWVWVIWKPFPPRVCYVYRCYVYYRDRVYVYYYRYCRRIWWWQKRWDIFVSAAVASGDSAIVDEGVLDGSTDGGRLFDGVKADVNGEVGCQFVNDLAANVAADTTYAQAY